MKYGIFSLSSFLIVAALGGCGGYKTSSDPSERDRGARATDLKLKFKTLPRLSTAGEPTMWDIKILDRKSGRGFKSFADEAGQRMRLVVVSHDLEEFQIVQPEYKDYGHFVMQGRVGVGPHRVFALYTPFGGAPVVQNVEFPPTEPGEGLKRIPKPKPVLIEDKAIDNRIEKTVGNARIELQTSTLRAGQSTNLSMVVRDNAGAPIKEFGAVLSSTAQVVAIAEDAKTLVAPALLPSTGTNGAPFVFTAVFPRAGKYKLWAQFAPKNETVIASFVVRVQDEKTKEKGAK